MPYYHCLIEWLVLAPHRVNSAGEMELTVAEAATLRACDFLTAAPGRWKIPALPRDLVRAYGLPAHLSEGWQPPAPRVAVEHTVPRPVPAVPDRPPADRCRKIDPRSSSSLRDEAPSVERNRVPELASASHTRPRRPAPTRGAYYAPARQAQRATANSRRLDAARAHFGHVLLRLVPQVRMCPERPHQYGSLLGHAITLRIGEPDDVAVFLNDLEAFVRSWRPTRTYEPSGRPIAHV